MTPATVRAVMRLATARALPVVVPAAAIMYLTKVKNEIGSRSALPTQENSKAFSENIQIITPEMIAAGVSIYEAWESSDDWSPHRLVASLYLAMWANSPQSK